MLIHTSKTLMTDKDVFVNKLTELIINSMKIV
ncbi:hypothetical protein SAMN04487886_12134 [Clostridium sp. DSM 8431]|nr:hypothetical protein SAMN04487886_12134 [Clostridium sp. DSM 8431]